MQRVLVLDNKKQPLMPCLPARARKLLSTGKAAVFRRYPFTIILKYRTGGDTQPMEVKIDPGSKTTGIAVTGKFQQGWTLLWAAELQHRGQAIKKALDTRRGIRKSRRNRKTRYRKPRFDNRRKKAGEFGGWLPPSLLHRVQTVQTWLYRLLRWTPVDGIACETVRFDTQILQNPEISSVEYQRGTLHGYEVWQYLLEKWKHQCAYCGAKNVSLEKDHVVPRSAGGSNRISNLVVACRKCNQAKGSMPVEKFLKNNPARLAKIRKQLKTSLRDTAAVNATRYAIGRMLKATELDVSFWSGGRTKFNRTQQGYSKTHWLDAACVGETGVEVYLPSNFTPVSIAASGHSSRQFCRMDRYGFPRTGAKPRQKNVHGFQTGDMVKAVVTAGKKAGIHIGRVAVRSTGSFNIKTTFGTVQGIGWKYCRILQKADGYNYY